MANPYFSIKKVVWDAEGNNGPEATVFFTAAPDQPYGYQEFEPSTLPREFILELQFTITRMIAEFTRDWK